MSQPCVLAVMAHPDDIEFLCAGTLLRLKAAGWRIALATLAQGDCGSPTLPPAEIAALRRAEAEASAARLGASYDCLGCLDLLVLLNETTIRAAVELLRRRRPELVITHSPADYMLDHEQTSAIVRTAAFGAPAGNFLTLADSPAPRLEHVPHLYYADAIEGVDALGEPIRPHLYVDISEQIEEKAALLACHASQREWLRAQHGLDEYLTAMRNWAAARGREAGVAYAEAFRQHRGHAYPQNDRLSEALGLPG